MLGSTLLSLELPLGDVQFAELTRHLELLLTWKRAVGLTSLRDPRQIIKRHFAESLFMASLLKGKVGKLVDIGSGGGFPGFPISVAQPQLEVTLVESSGRKAAFLKELVRNRASVQARWARFEDLKGLFEWVVVRGVAIPKLWPAIRERVDKLLIMTGAESAGEIMALEGFKALECCTVPWEAHRQVLIGMVQR